MYKILDYQEYSPATKLTKVEAPEISKKCKAGQFAILRLNTHGERFPLTFADWDSDKGTIDFVYAEVGKTTVQLGKMKHGEYIQDVVGPLGQPTHCEKFGNIVVVGGGIGISVAFPVAREMKKNGNTVWTIIGARTKELLFWEDKCKAVSDKFFVTTDDGSYGERGFVSQVVERLAKEGLKIDRVVAIGPVPMMKAVVATTKPFNIKTIVSLNPIMVDGTGMCGACRVEVAGKTKFACVDGPDFDGHEVDFALLTQRQKIYLEEEKFSTEKFKERNYEPCRCEASKARG